MNLRIEAFTARDQSAVKALVLEGLVEHWGYLDVTKNRDLDDIASSYAAGVFLVARIEDRLAGCGALLPHSRGVAQIVRMSVAQPFRRRKIGCGILQALVERSKQRGYHRLVVETTSTWLEVIDFYVKAGFMPTHHLDGDTYFALELGESQCHNRGEA